MGNQDKAFMKNLITVMGSLVVLAVIVFVTAQQLAGPGKVDIKDTEKNIARVGVSVAADDKVRVAAKVVGRKTVAQLGGTCMGCHTTGVAGSPKVGDKAAWAPRIKKGLDALVKSVIKGKGAMPPKGATALTDAEIKMVVEDMISKSK